MKISWIVAALASALAVGLWMKAPTVVTKEVPVEVVKIVTKEVPVEVIKEVEKPLPEIYKIAWEAYLNYSGAKFAANQGGVLKGVKSLRVVVTVADVVKNDISSSTIKTKIELELRKLGVRIDADSDVTLDYQLDVSKHSELLSYTESLMITQWVTLPRETGYIRTRATIWDKRMFGRVGEINVKELANGYDDMLPEFLNDYLTANPRVAN